MPERIKRVSQLAAMVGLSALLSAPVLAQTAEEQLVFPLKTDARLAMGDYVLPPGEYRLECIDPDEDVFELFEGTDANATPVAMIDAWNVPMPAGVRHNPSQVRLEIQDARAASDDMPVLKGWTILGDRWRIRDVVEADGSHALDRS